MTTMECIRQQSCPAFIAFKFNYSHLLVVEEARKFILHCCLHSTIRLMISWSFFNDETVMMSSAVWNHAVLSHNNCDCLRRWRCTVEWVSRLIALDTLRVRFNKKTWYCLTLFTPWYSHDFHLICLLFTTRQMHSRKFKFIDNFALVVDCLRLFLQKAPIYISSRVESNTWDRSRVINIFFFSFFH